MNQYTALISIIIFCSACSPSSPDSEYDNCVQNAAQAPTATGVRAAYENCSQRYTQNSKTEQAVISDDTSGSVAYAYWDGWNFQSGEMPTSLDGKGYTVFSVARYGVTVCKVALPEAMSETLFNDDGSFNKNAELNTDLVEICRPR